MRFPVGATFTDFKVEVHYPDGYTRFVTKKALLRTPEPASSGAVDRRARQASSASAPARPKSPPSSRACPRRFP